MAIKQQFYFVPLKKRERIVNKKDKKPYARVSKNGIFRVYRWVIEYLGYEWKPLFFKFYVDADKRALAFRILEKAELSDSVRLLNPKTATVSGSQFYETSVGNFVNSLRYPLLPTPKLEIEEYRDTDTIHDKLFYIVIPQGSGQLLQKKVETYKQEVSVNNNNF